MVKTLLAAGSALVTALLIFGVLLSDSQPSPVQNAEQNTQPTASDATTSELTTDHVTTQVGAPTAAETAVANQQTPASTAAAPQSVSYSVVGIVDGDTIKISMNGREETLRLIGMDTPETVDPRKPVQCFGKEASTRAKALLAGTNVRIEADATQDTRDKYGRLLVYVYRDDGLFYNKYMIEQGYAREYTYDTPYKYQAEFKAAQRLAQDNQRGLWSPDTCNSTAASSASSSLQAQPVPATTQSSGTFYTSSYHSAKYYYPASCDGWQSLSPSYLKSFASLEALLAAYPSRTKSPQCQ